MDIPKRDTPSAEILSRQTEGLEGIDAVSVQTCVDFMRVAKKTMAAFYEHFASHGISPGKYSILMEFVALDSGQALSPSDLASRIGVKRPTITGLVDGLIKQGFIKRANDIADRRRVDLVMTAKGRAFIAGFMPTQFNRMAALSGGLDHSDQMVFRQLLSSFEAGVTQMALDAPGANKTKEYTDG